MAGQDARVYGVIATYRRYPSNVDVPKPPNGWLISIQCRHARFNAIAGAQTAAIHSGPLRSFTRISQTLTHSFCSQSASILGNCVIGDTPPDR